MSVRRVVVVGDAMVDVVVRPLTDVAPTSDTPSRVHIGRGGSAANLAAAVARFGHDVHFVGVVGDDLTGRLFRDELGALGVSVHVEVVDGTTGVVVAVVAPDGQRAMLTDRGVNPRLSLDHVLGSIGERVDHVHLSGYTILDESTRSVGTALLEAMRARGVATSVDVCSLAPLMTMTPVRFLEAVSAATMLFANEEEALALSGRAGAGEALEWLSHRFEEVVVTRGAAGALAARDRERASAPSVSGTVIDTTGAGDAATGAYVASRISGHGLTESLQRAMANAAHVVSGLGATG